MMNARRVPGLSSVPASKQLPEGRLLVRVDRILYIAGQKPYFALSFRIEQPLPYSGQQIQTRLHATEKALWKLNWFLRDFAYDSQLLQEDRIEEKAVVGLRGVIKVSRVSVNGRAFTNVDAFAPAETWENGSSGRIGPSSEKEQSQAQAGADLAEQA